MKIGVLIVRINPGGVEKIAIQEVRALIKEGHEASLIVMSRKANGPLPFKDLLEGLPIVYLDDRVPRVLRWNVKIPFFYFFNLIHLTYPLILPFLIKKHEYDFFFIHNTYT